MDVTFLGTSSGTPTRERNVTSAALRFDDGRVWIVDCGEATQHQLLETDIRPGRIERIFLTHLHGDHCYGLPGLLASLAVHGRSEPVTVVGPPGVAEWIAVTQRISDLNLGYAISVIELSGRQELAAENGWTITAVPIPHRVVCWGYRFAEPVRPGHLDGAAARAAGVSGPDLGRLAAGESIQLADGRTVEPGPLIGPDRPGRVVAIFGDTSGADPADPAWHGCDLIVHECTYAADKQANAAQWGHATTASLAAFAAAVRPAALALTHFSSRYTAPGAAVTVADLVAEVAERCPGVPLHAADDFVRLPLPPRTPDTHA